MTVLSGAVDYWCNAFTPDRHPVWQRAIDNQGLSLKVERVGDEFCTADEMVARMDAAGFATLILPVAGRHEGAVAPAGLAEGQEIDNFDQVACRADEMDALASAYAGRFVGLWSVDPSAGAEGVHEAEHMVQEPWCVGLHNHTHSWDRAFDHPDFTPFYELCNTNDLPMVMQAGASGGRFPDGCGRPESIEGPAQLFPNVKFVLSHTGWPWTDETVAMVRRHPNVYLGTATWPPRRWSPELRAFLTTDGAGQALFATGFPTTGHNQAVRQFADPELALPADALAKLTATTARTVFTRLPAFSPATQTQEN